MRTTTLISDETFIT